MRIRRATAADASGIANVHVETWRAAYAGIIPASFLAQLSAEQHLQHWQRIANDTQRAVFVAEEEAGQIVGFAVGGPVQTPVEGCTGEIHAIYILPAAQRGGIGRQLVAASAQFLRDHGHTSLAIWVLRDNAPARAFYEALGGEPIAEQDIEIGGQTLCEVCYRWPNIDALLDVET